MPGIEPVLQRRERFPEHVVPGTTVQDRAVVGRLDPVDRIDRHDVEPIAAPDDQPLRPRLTFPQVQIRAVLRPSAAPAG
jgi:hypothetical protein